MGTSPYLYMKLPKLLLCQNKNLISYFKTIRKLKIILITENHSLQE